jgi:hypothetical protein
VTEETNGTSKIAPAGGVITPKQLAEILENHFRAVAVGLAVTNPMVPQQIMWDAIAEAMGNVLSGVTQSQDLAATLKIRGHLSDIVSKAIRQRYPSVVMAGTSSVLKPANAN